MKALHMIAYLLVWAGGINWLLVGLFQYNLVEMIFGSMGLANIIYILVGLATFYTIYSHIMMKDCRICSPKGKK